MKTTPVIFPELKTKSWVEVDLNALSKRDHGGVEINPLNNAHFCFEWVEKIARELGVDFTFGGWGEDRSHLWRGHYHDPNVMRHLGVDYNVPAETLVVAPAEMTVINAWPDPDQDGGWGGQLIVKLAKPYRGADYVIFGHLAHDSLPAVGKTFAAAEPFAVLGGAHENGGWFPHLHVQCFTQKIYDKYALDLTKIDGYGLNGEPLEPDFPDPTGLVAGTD